MIIENFPENIIYISDDNAVTLNMMTDKDEYFLVYYFKNQKEIFFGTTIEDLVKLQNIFKAFNKNIVNFSCLPIYYEVFFYISLSLENFDDACKYLRSFKYCINKIELLEDKDEKSHLYLEALKKHYKNCLTMINIFTTYKETGNKDSLTKYFLSEDYVSIEKELKIRMLMRQLKVSRTTVLSYFKNIK